MQKILIYTGFIAGGIAVIAAFVTSTTYIQLGIAILLYLPLTYFAFRTFGSTASGAGISLNKPLISVQVPAIKSAPEEDAAARHKRVEVADIDKRTFLKLIGATGISFFVFSFLGRRIDSLLFGNSQNANNSQMNTINPSSQTNQTGSFMDGYKITDIDEGVTSYYGFINQEGAWLVMRQDTQTNAFRYAKGPSGFTENWIAREKLQYDYFYKLF